MTESERRLLAAIRDGDAPSVRRLLDQGVSPGFATPGGTTPLIAAADAAQWEIASVLLEAGADHLAGDEEGMTPLIFTAERGSAAFAEQLIARGENLECQGKNGVRPLMLAAHGGHLPLVKLLLERGADVDAVGGQLHQYELLRDFGDVDNLSQGTALMWASKNGHLEVVKALLAKGAMAQPAGPFQATPLMWAAGGGSCDLIKFFLGAGADIHAKDLNDWTALHYAVKNIHSIATSFLVERGASPYAITRQGTAISLLPDYHETTDDIRKRIDNTLMALGGCKLRRILKGEGPALEAAIKSLGLTLEEACAADFGHAIRAIIKSGAPEIEDLIAGGVKVLKTVAEMGDAALFSRLVENGADPTVPGLLTSAASGGSVEIGRLLFERGARGAATFLTEGPLLAATRGAHVGFVRLLLEHEVAVDGEDGRKAFRWIAGREKTSPPLAEIRRLLLESSGGDALREEAPASPEAGASADSVPAGETRYPLGPLLVFEYRGPLYVKRTTIVVDDEKKKELVKCILEAGFPDEMADGMRHVGGGMVSFSFSLKSLELEVLTVDEYVAREEKIADIPERELAGEPEFDAKKMRADLTALLNSNFAVVYRYIEDRSA